jgi:hypothetical protein
MAEVVLVTTAELQPGAKLDQFTIVEAIGHGAFSDVFLAEDPTGRQVVLKCPHESIMGDVSTFDRFRRELEISKHLHHPGIQRPIEFTTDRSRPYMVMEYIDGETLRALLPARSASRWTRPWTSASSWQRPWPTPTPREWFTGPEARERARDARGEAGGHGLRRGLHGRRSKADVAVVLDRPRARRTTCRPSRSRASAATPGPTSTPSA